MDRKIMCVLCPNGCQLKVEYDEKTRKVISVKGNKCKRGPVFAEQEINDPLRTLTFSVLVEGGSLPLVSARSKKPIRLSQMLGTVEKLKEICLKAPVKLGDVIYKDDNCKIIATKNINEVR